MYRTPVIIGKISPDRRHRHETEVSCFALKGLISIMTGDVLYIIPLITRLLAKRKNNFTRCVFLQFTPPFIPGPFQSIEKSRVITQHKNNDYKQHASYMVSAKTVSIATTMTTLENPTLTNNQNVINIH